MKMPKPFKRTLAWPRCLVFEGLVSAALQMPSFIGAGPIFSCEMLVGATVLWECHARSAHNAKFWMSTNTRTPVSAPFHKFLVPYQAFF